MGQDDTRSTAEHFTNLKAIASSKVKELLPEEGQS
jgi:hypothetical protein